MNLSLGKTLRTDGMQLGVHQANQNGQKRREKTTKMAIEIVIQSRLDFYELHLLKQQSQKKQQQHQQQKSNEKKKSSQTSRSDLVETV